MLAMDARRFLCAMQELTGGTLVATHQVMIEAWDKCTETSAKAAGNFVRHQFFEGSLDAADVQSHAQDLGMATMGGGGEGQQREQ